MKKQIIIAIGLVILPFVYAFYLYPTLPAKIPMHFNMNGEVDGWGSRESIYLLPSIMAGFKLPWTLENEANWNATHALAGKVWTMGGALQMISALLLNGAGIFIAFMSITAVMIIIPSVFSYRMFKRGNTTK